MRAEMSASSAYISMHGPGPESRCTLTRVMQL
jgi:hypothetical protein